jgi:ABC-type Na+ efflux pump permease subunit
MHPRMIWAIVRKDFLDIWLNKSALAGLVFPIILSLIWLLIANLVGGTKSTLSIYSPGNSSLVQAVVQVFQGAIIVQAGSATEVKVAFGPNGAKIKSDYTVGLVIPPDFESLLRAGSLPVLSLYLNGSMVSEQTQALLQ